MNVVESKVYLERERRIKLATRHLKVAIGLLYSFEDTPPPRKRLDVPLSSSYWDLLTMLLDAAQSIIEELPDDFFMDAEVVDIFGLLSSIGGSAKHNSSDQPLEDAEKIVVTLNNRRNRGDLLRKALLLDNTTGRSPEEAAAYAAKAEDLRARARG